MRAYLILFFCGLAIMGCAGLNRGSREPGAPPQTPTTNEQASETVPVAGTTTGPTLSTTGTPAPAVDWTPTPGASPAVSDTPAPILSPTRKPTFEPSLTPTTLVTLEQTAVPAEAAAACQPPPVGAPELPAVIPGTAALDPETGLHVTGRPQVIDPQSYRLVVSGKVDHPLRLSYNDLRCMKKISAEVQLICPSVFVDYGNWAGVPLSDVLDRAGVQPGAATVNLVSADGYQVEFLLEQARRPENFLAYEFAGRPLPALHGFPLRAVFPGMPGNAWVKWILELVVK